MKNKSLSIVLVSFTFLGCSKTITIQEPINTYEAGTISYEEPVNSYEIVSSSSPEVPYIRQEPVVSPTSVPVIQQEPFNISPLEAFDKIQENLDVLVLDVRNPNEIPQDGKIANSVMIPLPYLAQKLNHLDKSKTIIVYCHTGNRSVEATKLLRSHGFNAINMRGGIQAWKRAHLGVVWK